MTTTLDAKPFGDAGALLSVPDAAHARVLADALRSSFPDAVEVIPGLNTVVVTFDEPVDFTAVSDVAANVTFDTELSFSGKIVTIPVHYDGDDLPVVAETLGMSVQEVIDLHTSSVYEVSMLGFAPGFPYLTGLNPALTVPRLATPRTRVPAGSIGLAAGQTCVYPSSSPGGWMLIGRTDVALFDPNREEPALLAPGDRVLFEVA